MWRWISLTIVFLPATPLPSWPTLYFCSSEMNPEVCESLCRLVCFPREFECDKCWLVILLWRQVEKRGCMRGCVCVHACAVYSLEQCSTTLYQSLMWFICVLCEDTPASVLADKTSPKSTKSFISALPLVYLAEGLIALERLSFQQHENPYREHMKM